MTLQTILNFTLNIFSAYAGSGLWSYFILPVFALGIVIILRRVVKYICMIY